MKIFNFLKKDHRLFKKLLNDLEKSKMTDLKKREKLFTAFKSAMLLHSKMEEQIFYPLVNKKKPTHFLTQEAYQEHFVMYFVLKNLDEIPKDSEEWMALLTVLRENLFHHIIEEEKFLFPKAKNLISDLEDQKMAKEMEAFRI